ncbi:anti-sigma factor antagonist [Nocardiopsis gilva YIM 90087]|uniref:Anti-sigma factor antagonist n=1 Tax=Nocardiopsis gilva YIM 90087 TaxID=1235441 RepID=A0A223S6S1_9ACTN|nr:STAS domain-containing protein [Nocardiopsis gilva]ASU83805.1 anti-sigma factor antagonist [Nocardiopsis gilva YIM 90087]
MSGGRSEYFPCREAVVVPVRGEIDIATADDMRDHVLRAAHPSPATVLKEGVAVRAGAGRRGPAPRPGSPCVIVDLSGVEFFDASGVRALMSAYRVLTREGRHMVLAEPSAAAARILETLRMDEVFEIYPIVEMALANSHAAQADADRVRRAPGTE